MFRLGTHWGMAVAVMVLAMAPPAQAQDETQVFVGNLHSHTALSDGRGTPAEAYEYARDVAGLDYLAITEHNHAQAGDIAGNHALYTGPGARSLIPTANSFTEEGVFIALYGQEFSSISTGNHMNVLDAPHVIDVANGDFRALFENWLPLNRDTQGQEPLLLLNHPATGSSPAASEYGIDDYDSDVAAWRAALDPRASLINIINGPSHTKGVGLQSGRPAEGEFRRYLDLGLHVAPTADQDNHQRNWGSATHARTAVLAPALTKAALLTAMRQRRVYATEDRNLRLIYRVNGELLGARISGAGVPGAGTPLSLSLEITDDDEPEATYIVEVFSDEIGGDNVAAVVRSQTVVGDGNYAITGVAYQGGPQYVYLRVRQDDGDRAWTAPVWFEPASAPGPDSSQGDGDVPAISVTLDVNERAETAHITNSGAVPLDLTGWSLLSIRGNQVFDQFPAGFTLAPGASITVTSGPNAQQGNGFLLWTNLNIWNNSGDPGQLRDPDGVVIAEGGS